MSMGAAAAAMEQRATRIELTTARFLGIVGEQGQVVTPAGDVLTAAKATAEWPARDSTVWLLIVDGVRLMLSSPGHEGSTWGRVVNVGSVHATVEYPAGSERQGPFLIPRGVTPAVGDAVLLSHENGGVIVAAYATAVEPAPVVAPTRPGTVESRTAEVNPTWDGTATPAGFWIAGSDLYTRNSGGGPNYATIGYGGKVDQLVPAGATIQDAAVWLDVRRTGSAHSGGLHTLTGPQGVPSPTSTFEVTPRDGWHPIPAEVARALADGEASGITLFGGVGTVYGSTRRNPGNGRLRVRYNVEA